jgi:hypothetical protein
MKIKKNILSFCIAIALFCIGGLGYFFMYFTITSVVAETSTILAEVDKAEEKNQELVTLKKTISTSEEDRQTLSSYFVTDDTIVIFLENLEALGATSNTEVKISSVTQNTEDKKLSVAISSVGGFGNVFRFLELIEQVPYATEVKTLSLATRDDPVSTTENPSKLWEADIQIELTSYVSK